MTIKAASRLTLGLPCCEEFSHVQCGDTVLGFRIPCHGNLCYTTYMLQRRWCSGWEIRSLNSAVQTVASTLSVCLHPPFFHLNVFVKTISAFFANIHITWTYGRKYCLTCCICKYCIKVLLFLTFAAESIRAKTVKHKPLKYI